MTINPKILAARRIAISRAIEKILDLCKDRGCIIGIGTGSTIAQFIEECSKHKLIEILKKSLVVCSSSDTVIKLAAYGVACIDLLSLSTLNHIDIYVDSADEVDERCYMIKGGGGALLREKILTELAYTKIFVVDYAKLSSYIGSKTDLPVEIVPQAYPLIAKKLKELGLPFSIRMSTKKKGPVITDSGNYLIDIATGPLENPEAVEKTLKSMTGVIETGIFHPYHVTEIIIGTKELEVRTLYPPD